MFVAPFLLLFVAFGVYPMLFALRLSFTNWHGGADAQWIGLDNYVYLLQNPLFWQSLGNSAVLWLLVVPAQLALGLVTAVALDNAKMRGRGFFRVALLIPYVTPVVAMAQVWIIAFDRDYGVVNAALGVLGLPDIGWLTTTTWAKPTIALLFFWKTTGFVIIIMLSGLQSIPHELYEAAALDGAGRTRQLVQMTVPLMARTVMFIVVVQTLGIFQMFAEPFVVTEGGPYSSTTTAGLYLYKHIQVSDLGTGAANSFLLVVILVAMSVATVRLVRPRD
ncbi:sugar ABC transporter permease [Actinotalea sp. M2MS4P-6]|uniref:carbohydrate ABC transporter permease n=1 Tax=Actinotalea sp. M2MS4P-6 TaxID=2983762 RepID=UPI0021E4B63C|nr:sugar ABC transporter permease [Actinotalea sp. M2MS4P-6]MCV2395642.1 sugar ABC transporter permease [Actinotalea sp. M2MS4P-6]